jgi:hypothetical protein
MTKKQFITLAVAFLAVAGFYYYLFGGRIHRPDIQISHTFRPNRRAPVNAELGMESLNFGLNGSFQLTSVKVISADELKTNKYPHPLWELTTTSNSIPTRAFTYGMKIRGMHSAVKGAMPTALEANIPYLLLVEAGRLKGEHNFTITEAAPAPQ